MQSTLFVLLPKPCKLYDEKDQHQNCLHANFPHSSPSFSFSHPHFLYFLFLRILPRGMPIFLTNNRHSPWSCACLPGSTPSAIDHSAATRLAWLLRHAATYALETHSPHTTFLTPYTGWGRRTRENGSRTPRLSIIAHHQHYP